jgi:riboflavin biosynthesis pyrimidine reductase
VTTRAIFVIDNQGRWIDDDGSSRGVSSSKDLAHLVAMRRRSDVILTSGKTARDNRYKPASCDLVVITRQPAETFPLLHDPSVRLVSGEVIEILNGLTKKYKNVLIEFGPQLLSLCIEAGKIHEILVSVTGVCSYSRAIECLRTLPFRFSEFENTPIVLEDDFKVFQMKRTV